MNLEMRFSGVILLFRWLAWRHNGLNATLLHFFIDQLSFPALLALACEEQEPLPSRPPLKLWIQLPATARLFLIPSFQDCQQLHLSRVTESDIEVAFHKIVCSYCENKPL